MLKSKVQGRIKLLLISLVFSLVLTGCNALKNEWGNFKSAIKGRSVTVQTYDEESNIIDRVHGKSVYISPEDKFATRDKDGNKTKDSSVINLTVGGESMIHVGSSLLMYEDGLVDVFNEYSKTVDIKNFSRSTPFINKMVNDFKNMTSGKSKLILVRSQSGKPLATFVGDNVSYFTTGIDKSTGILIDDKYLFIYRCDYTIYDLNLLR